MSSREAILKAIKEAKPYSESALPEVNILHTTYEDLDAKFASTLAGVGGIAVHLDSLTAIDSYIKEHYKEATVIVSTVEGLHVTTKELNGTDDPHTLKDVDLAIIKGQKSRDFPKLLQVDTYYDEVIHRDDMVLE